MKLAFVTPGAANMICGSCLSDNALVKALLDIGVDAQLIPTYTPIRTDEENVSIDRVFFGGINVYLDQHVPLFRWLPSFVVRWLDHPAVLRWATSRGISTDASKLGPMTVSMLKGADGRMKREVGALCDYLVQLDPDVVSFSNVMIAASAAALKKRQPAIKITVTLQGDDIFLQGLPDKYLRLAIAEIQDVDRHIDGYMAHSRFYADKMSEYLGMDRAKIRIVPLGVRDEDLQSDVKRPDREDGVLRVGYLARLAPEKGLHLVCEAVAQMRSQQPTRGTTLRVAGWLGKENQDYAEKSFDLLRKSHPKALEHLGEVDREQKRTFLSQIDVLCVPSPYEEPKGLYALEALAAGVPVVSPRHGAFPELAEETGGMALFEPNSVAAITSALTELALDPEYRKALGERGQHAVREQRSATAASRAVLNEMRSL